MANTIDGDLAVQQLVRIANSTMPQVLPPVPRFANVVPVSASAPSNTHQLPDVSSTSTVQSDPTNWESGNASIGKLTVTTAQLSISFHISSADIQNGSLLEHLSTSNLHTFAGAIMDVILTPLTTANYGAPAVATPEASFGMAEVSTLANAIKSPRRALLLSTLAFSNIANHLTWADGEWRLPGWSFVGEISDWSSAGTNVYGAALDPSALIVATGQPLMPRAPMVQSKVISTPLQLPALASFWPDSQLRLGWASFDLVIGVVTGKSANLKLVSSS